MCQLGHAFPWYFALILNVLVLVNECMVIRCTRSKAPAESKIGDRTQIQTSSYPVSQTRGVW